MKTINEYIQKTYGSYDDRVLMFMSRVYEDCIANNEKLSNYFYCCLDLLATQLKLYFIASDVIDEQKKISSEDSYRRISKDPSISVLNKCHEQILNILAKLSLSPFEQAKLSRLKNGDGDQDAEELLDNLIK